MKIGKIKGFQRSGKVERGLILKWTSLTFLIIVFFVFNGCASSRLVEKPTENSPDLHMSSNNEQINMSLNNVLIPNGPGSWIKDAKWDEYVVTITNLSSKPLSIAKISLVDPRGVYLDAGTDVITLEKTSERLAKAYKEAGIDFAVGVAPSALIVAGVAAGTVGAVAASTILLPVALVAAPIVYFKRQNDEVKDREDVLAEFNRRRLANGMTITGNATITGSLFFPMVPNPQDLVMEYRIDNTISTIELKTQKIQGIHVVSKETPQPTTTTKDNGSKEAPQPTI